MSEEYEIIFITEEGRAIKNNKTGKIYHSEFEIIDEKSKQIEDLQQKVEQLENIRKEAIDYIKARSFDEVSVGMFDNDFNCKENLLNILNKGDNKE